MQQDNDAEALDIPKRVRLFIYTLGWFLILLSLTVYLTFILDSERFISPSDIEASFLLSLGLIMVLLPNIPWQRLSFAGVEIERVVQEQAIDYSEEINLLQEKIEQLTTHSNHSTALHSVSENSTQKEDNNGEDSSSLRDDNQKLKVLLCDFLSTNDNWGFTPSRIKNWGGEQEKFKELKTFSNGQIRHALLSLIEAKDVKTRVSKKGNILFQFNSN